MQYRYIFQLIHIKIIDSFEKGDIIVDKKELGVYSCKKYALAAQDRFKVLEGFRDFPDNFTILKRRIILHDCNVQLSSGMSIFLLKNEFSEGDYDVTTDFGFFTNMNSIDKEISTLLRHKHKTKEYLNIASNYYIGEFKLDIDNPYWAEGFKSDCTPY